MEGFSLRQADQPSKKEQLMVSNICNKNDNVKKPKIDGSAK